MVEGRMVGVDGVGGLVPACRVPVGFPWDSHLEILLNKAIEDDSSQ